MDIMQQVIALKTIILIVKYDVCIYYIGQEIIY